ncbi:hypothetical protein Q8G40_28925, partial [Klebsiella pneumoniae]|uniref:hypothetical protein n=1 Tax=Klebsiella pneumoniae TaxID=573 RepID=UPI00301335DF
KSPRWTNPWPELHAEHRVALQYRLCLIANGAFDGMFSPGVVAAGPALYPLLIERVRVTARPGAPRPGAA